MNTEFVYNLLYKTIDQKSTQKLYTCIIEAVATVVLWCFDKDAPEELYLVDLLVFNYPNADRWVGMVENWELAFEKHMECFKRLAMLLHRKGNRCYSRKFIQVLGSKGIWRRCSLDAWNVRCRMALLQIEEEATKLLGFCIRERDNSIRDANSLKEFVKLSKQFKIPMEKRL